MSVGLYKMYFFIISYKKDLMGAFSKNTLVHINLMSFSKYTLG